MNLFEMFLPLILAVTGIVLGWYVKGQQARQFQIAAKIAISVFEMVEANYKDWGIYGADKMVKYLSIFMDRFRAATGENPSEQVLDYVEELAEEGVSAQNEKK
jgi:hypothetical protein